MRMGNHAALSTVMLNLDDDDQAEAVDAFVLAHPQGTPFHRSAWMIAVERATGNRSHMLAAVGPSGSIRGVLPCHHVQSRLFGQALVSSAFAVGGGILANDPAAVAALASAAQDLARANGDLPVELRGGPSPAAPWTTRVGEHVGFCRQLAADDEAELLAVPRKHRAELRKALANPALRVEHGRSARNLRDHYRVYGESVRHLGTPVFPRRLFQEVLLRFGEDADITLVYDRDKPVSAVLTLYHQGRVMPFWGGGVGDARRLRSNELMYYRLMAHGRSRGMTQFDFGRSKAGSGQAAWKKSFGFTAEPLAYHDWSPSGATRDISPHSARYQWRIALWKRLPLPLANLFGPLISRGLG
ncbi:FemAB family XrtA/PEP-CTERM system-associated protein [Sphingobium sp. AN558]|uniref:FemAB family XrtA/PEP-CTERM system-associated protein n=1 Tax=Sphingobium sp. AN558 TaxID=3133442 RepID=UPI0030C0E321